MKAVVLRLGELFLKGKNRSQFKAHLGEHVRRVVRDLPVDIETHHARIVVKVEDEHLRRTMERLGLVFGLTSMSAAVLVEPEEAAITREAVALARAWVEARASAGGARPRFKVESRRSDKRFPLSSLELSTRIGAAIVETLDLPVDVHRPELVVNVEVGPERSFVYTDVIPGPGGLPVGSTGRVNLLLSGGIDSPVAGWMAMKRGCRIDATYFHSFPYTGDKTKEKVLDLARLLAPYQGHMAVWVVPFTEVQKSLRAAGPPNHAIVLYRRMMVRTAAIIAERNHALALVTGESLGQVSSQTLDNLATIEAASPIPILRPLITFDKVETMAVARRIGTYDTSIEPYDDCCSLFVPGNPATRAHRGRVEQAESRVDVAVMARELADAAERHIVEG